MLFSKEEIIIIIKAIISDLENEKLGLMEEEFYIPKPIMEKIDFLEDKDRMNFFNSCDDIARNLLILKTGELNEINNLHSEILNLSKDKLKRYLMEK